MTISGPKWTTLCSPLLGYKDLIRWSQYETSLIIIYCMPKISKLKFKQVVYILDQVKAMEEELLLRIKQQGFSVKPQILVVSL